MAELRTGVRVALDWGKARIGVAACDAAGILAYPVTTVPSADAQRGIETVLTEYEPFEIVVGLPVDLRGCEGISAAWVRGQAAVLASSTPIPVRLVDERMSTAAASRNLGQAGRNTRKQRTVIDQAAAVEILRAALEAERSGVLGELVPREETP